MRTVAIVQARMNSSRLPGKVLCDIHGKPLIERLYERLLAVEELDEIVIATTTRDDDNVLVDWLMSNGIPSYRGSESDVLDRFYQCAVTANAEAIVRVTADDPLKDPGIISRAISLLHGNVNTDYVSNTIEPTYPEGLDIEVFTMAALEKAHTEAELKSEREHVTPYIWSHPKLFNVINFAIDTDLSAWRWTVDKPEDLEFVRAIFAHFIDEPLIDFEKIVDFIWQNPSLVKINNGTVRNEGYLNSLEVDRK